MGLNGDVRKGRSNLGESSSRTKSEVEIKTDY